MGLRETRIRMSTEIFQRAPFLPQVAPNVYIRLLAKRRVRRVLVPSGTRKRELVFLQGC